LIFSKVFFTVQDCARLGTTAPAAVGVVQRNRGREGETTPAPPGRVRGESSVKNKKVLQFLDKKMLDKDKQDVVFCSHKGGIEMKARDIVKNIMERKELSNAEFARTLGITPTALWDRLNTKKAKDIPTSTLNEMLRALGYKIMIVPDDTEVPKEGYTVEIVE
jgi:DNA-binding Xre family transcriptional regulator